MENKQNPMAQPGPKKSSKTWLYAVIAVLIVAIVGIAAYFGAGQQFLGYLQPEQTVVSCTGTEIRDRVVEWTATVTNKQSALVEQYRWEGEYFESQARDKKIVINYTEYKDSNTVTVKPIYSWMDTSRNVTTIEGLPCSVKITPIPGVTVVEPTEEEMPAEEVTVEPTVEKIPAEEVMVEPSVEETPIEVAIEKPAAEELVVEAEPTIKEEAKVQLTKVDYSDCGGFPDITSYDKELCYAFGYAKDIGAITGSGVDGKAYPDNPVNRAEAIKIITMATTDFDPDIIYYSKDDEPYFIDISANDWFYNVVWYAFKEGYVLGYEDRTLRPNNEVTRAEILSLVLKQFPSLSVSEKEANYIDVQIGSWVEDFARIAYKYNLFPPEYLYPDVPTTRGEVAKILYRLHIADISN